MKAVENIEIGKTYAVNHRRKGLFKLKVLSLGNDFVTGNIVEGKTTCVLESNDKYEGEEITIKSSLASFYNI